MARPRQVTARNGASSSSHLIERLGWPAGLYLGGANVVQPPIRMKTELLLLTSLAFAATLVSAQEVGSSASASTTNLHSLQWNTNQSHWDRILQEPRPIPELRLGKSGFVIGGPLIETFRGRRLPTDASRGRKFLALPVVNLFVPQRMPQPPGGTGRYFAWRNNTRSWSEIPSPRLGDNVFSPAYNEPQGVLISIRRGSR